MRRQISKALALILTAAMVAGNYGFTVMADSNMTEAVEEISSAGDISAAEENAPVESLSDVTIDEIALDETAIGKSGGEVEILKSATVEALDNSILSGDLEKISDINDSFVNESTEKEVDDFLSEFENILNEENVTKLEEFNVGTEFTKGDGTKDNPFWLAGRDDFIKFLQNKSDVETYYILGMDVALNESLDSPTLNIIYEGENRTKSPYNKLKHLDGGGHTVSNVYMYGNSNQLLGLIGGQCEVENLTIDGVRIVQVCPATSKSARVGLFTTNEATLENCKVTGKYSLGFAKVGSDKNTYEAGGMAYKGSAVNCSFDADMEVKTVKTDGTAADEDVINLGGLFYETGSSNSKDSEISGSKDCKFAGSIKIPRGQAAGIAYKLYNYNTLIENCETTAEAEIIVDNSNNLDQGVAVAGIAIFAQAQGTESYCSVKNCKNYATLKTGGRGDAAGIAGNIRTGQGEFSGNINYSDNLSGEEIFGIAGDVQASLCVKDCINYGNLTSSENTTFVCGLFQKISVRENDKVENCVNNGNLSSTQEAYGIAKEIKNDVRSDYYFEEAPLIGIVNNGDIVFIGESGSYHAAGICYYLSVPLKDSGNNGNIEYKDGTVAGIGHNTGSSYGNDGVILTNCYNTGDISGKWAYGLFEELPHEHNGYINCYNSGNVTGSSTAAGFGVKSTGTIKRCYNSGKIQSGTGNAAGLFLDMSYAIQNTTIEDCYNSGDVTSTNGSRAAGFFCEFSRPMDSMTVVFKNCYNVGKVTTSGKAGSGPAAIVSNYSEMSGTSDAIECSGIYYLDNVEKGIGRVYPEDLAKDIPTTKCSATDMQKAETFKGFDFTNTWSINSASDYKYPVLQGEKIEGAPFAITLDANGGSCATASIMTDEYGKITSTLPTASKDGKEVFAGWSLSPDNYNRVTAATVFRAATTIYAYYAELYTVTFDANGGECDVTSALTNPDGKLESLPVPLKAGFSFDGWYIGEQLVDLDKIYKSNTTVVAKWTEEEDPDATPTPTPEPTPIPTPEPGKTFWCAPIADQVYTGKAIAPTNSIYVYSNDKLLKKDTDYTVRFLNNTKAADKNSANAPTAVITGKGNYTGVYNLKFSILPADISKISLDDLSVAHTGSPIAIKQVVKLNGKTLKDGVDYVISKTTSESGKVSSITEAGNYSLYVVGIGNYTGYKEFNFTITKKAPASKVTIKKIPNQKYNDGAEIRPELDITYQGKDVKSQFDITFKNNKYVGTATVVATAKADSADFEGSKKATFNIIGTSVGGVKIGIDGSGKINPVEYTGGPVTPSIGDLYLNGTKLVEGKHYRVSYENNIKAGTAKAIVTGLKKGGYTGTKVFKFKITPFDAATNKGNKISVKDISGNEIIDVQYSKGGVKPVVSVSFNGVSLTEKKDYTVKYSNNTAVKKSTDVKAPTITVTFKGNCKGKITKQFTIIEKDISVLKEGVKLEDKIISDKVNDWKQTKATIVDLDGKKLKAGSDYLGGWEFYSDVACTKALAGDTYNDIKSSLENNTVYVKIIANENSGRYKGTVVGSYRISSEKISKASIVIKSKIYTGSEIILTGDDIESATIGKNADMKTLKYGEDYEFVSYSKNINKGTAVVVVRGLGNYCGTKSVKFKITNKTLAE